ncbi:MAG: ABC transporter transmembrane domain-containing protein, partial [Pseudomonadota bacterium]
HATKQTYRVYLLGLLLLAIIGAMADIMLDYQIKEIIDSVSINKSSDIGGLILTFVGFKLLVHGVFFVNRLLDIKYRPKMIKNIVTNMYQQTIQQSPHWFDSRLAGEISNKIGDFQSSVTMLITHCFEASVSIVTIIILLVVMVKVNGTAAIVLLGFVL